MPGHRLPGMRGIPLRGDVADYPPYLELIPGLRLVRRSAATGGTQSVRLSANFLVSAALRRPIRAGPSAAPPRAQRR